MEIQNFGFLALSLVGLFFALYIRYKKNNKQNPVCYVGKGCGSVTNSQYATTFGVPNEILGILYYSLIIFINSILLLTPSLHNQYMNLTLWVLIGGGVLFVLYLLFLQKFMLGKWCQLCLLTTSPSFIIFGLMFL